MASIEEEICRILNNLGYDSLEECIEYIRIWKEVSKQKDRE